ncbi:MAG: ABC transporter permease [Cytophagales bacterium]|nr:ABC transporter permease [Cytophagales bacterium]
MYRYLYSFIKEIKLLLRDTAGVLMLFVMPLILIFIITFIQDSSFKTIKDSPISLILVNDDKDSLGVAIEKGLDSAKIFKIETLIDGKPVTKEQANQVVASGEYKIGIYIPAGSTEAIQRNARRMAKTTFMGLGAPITSEKDTSQITIFMDPVTKQSFRSTVYSNLEKYIGQIELYLFFKAFTGEMTKVMPEVTPPNVTDIKTISLKEVYSRKDNQEIVPNSVQHNVPAWTMFAMFFIVVSISGSILQERVTGTGIRLRTLPNSFLPGMFGKLFAYMVICVIQFWLMVCLGLFVFPKLGLPTLVLGSHWLATAATVASSALAATGYGYLVGTVAGTRDQAASFGAISVMVLAAIGGIWVPTFVMPESIRMISNWSPLNWGLEAFYSLFLRDGTLADVGGQCLKLLAFAVVTLTFSFYYERRRQG